MSKITWKPGTMLAPVPPALISCGTVEKPNVMTAAWTGIVNSEPPMTYVSIRPSRYSYGLIKESGEFVINLTTLPLAEAADFCGVKSGRNTDKFQAAQLSPLPCSKVKAPQIAESPVSLECRVREIFSFGSHDMFLAEIVAVNVEESFIDDKGRQDLEKAGLVAYAHGHYYTLGRNLGGFGFSVNKERLKKLQKARKAKNKDEKKISRPKEKRPKKAPGRHFRGHRLKAF